MIEFTSDSANLGDNLMLTPMLNYTPCKLHLLKEEWMEFTAEIFKGMCEIEWFTDKAQMRPPPYANIRRPWSKRLLMNFGLDQVPAIPIMKLTAAEKEDGQRFTTKLQNHFQKPLCVLKAVPGLTSERIVPPEIIGRIVSQNSDVQFVTFSFSDRHPKARMRSPAIPGVFTLEDFPVRAEASVYAAIGRYVGCDSGPYHMMLAVGGKADVLCPNHSGSYDYDLTHFREDCWLDEAIRVAYQNFNYPLTEGVTGVRL